MSTSTTKLQLLKPAGTETVNVLTALDDNLDKIDLNTPTRLCTSSTRPGTPFDGQLIKETDTGNVLQYDLASTAWIALVRAIDGAAQGAYKNALRNGDFSIAQRGPGPFTAVSVYTLDGWQQEFVNGSMSTTQQTAVIGNPAQLDGAKYCLQTVVVGTAAAGDYAVFNHPIESVYKYAGKKVTLTFKAKVTAGTPKIGISLRQYFGTGGAPSATVNTAIQAVTLSTTETEYSVTFTVPSIAGKTLGTNGDDQLVIKFYISSGATNNAIASNIGVQSFTLVFYDVQLELGFTKSVFERLSQQAMLSWCQRYFVRIANTPCVGTGISTAATTGLVSLRLPVQMRAIPTGVATNGANLFSIYHQGGSLAVCTGLSVNTALSDAVLLSFAAPGLNIGEVVILIANSASSAFDITAEL